MVKENWLIESSEEEEEDIWEEEEEESEYEDSGDEDWVEGEDGVRYPKRFGTYERDMLGIMDELNSMLPGVPE